MNVSYYIKELLFSKQPVYLPNIGVFEVESVPAQIDEKLGTITPPSKKVVFKDKEKADLSVLANYISRNEKIATTTASAEIERFAADVLSRLKRGEEYELDGIGTLRMLGAEKIIFLPISSYSNTSAAFGFPTISIDGSEPEIEPEVPAEPAEPIKTEVTEPAVEAVSEEPAATEDKSEEFAPEEPEAVVEPEPAAESAEPDMDDDDVFELIDDDEEVEEEPVSGNEDIVKPEEKPAEPKAEEPAQDEELEAPVAAPVQEEEVEVPEVPAEEPESEPKSEPEPEFKPEPEAKPVESIAVEPRVIPVESKATVSSDDSSIEVKRSRMGWIWTFLIVIGVLAIALVALYHYKPECFGFILPSQEKQVVEPKVPSAVDSSYLEALTGAASDTISKSDSAASKDSVAVKSAASSNKSVPTVSPAKSKLSSSEVEEIINEKLKQGLSEGKKADTQKFQTSTITKKTSAAVQSQPSSVAKSTPSSATGQYNVIVASVASQKEAQKVIASLKAKGYSASVLSGSGKIRISVGAYPNAKQAANAASKAKAALNVEAWVLSPGK